VVVVAIEPESPAAQARLEQGDVILALDGEPVSGVDDLVRLLNGDRIGHSIELRLLKRGEMRAVTLTPVERKTTAPRSR
jgi:S1-C subfamily serine protease